MKRLYGILTVAVVLVSACGEPAGPLDEEQQRQDFLSISTPVVPLSLGRDEEELTFARLADGVEAEVQDTSFWAVRGQSRTLVVHYRNNFPTAQPLLEFRVGANSLQAYPDGQPVQPGDSVRIAVTLDAQRRYIFRFTPHGLKFSPSDPARLLVNYDGAAADVNGDELINFLDSVLQLRWRIWRQDMPNAPWVQIPTLRVPFLDLLDGRVTHFTGFALAT